MRQSRRTLLLSVMLSGSILSVRAEDTQTTFKKYSDLFMQSLLAGGLFGMSFGGYLETETYPASDHVIRYGLGSVVGCSGVLCGSRVMTKVDKIIDSMSDQTTQNIPKRVLVVWALGHTLGLFAGKGLTKLLFMYGSQVKIDWEALLGSVAFHGTYHLVSGGSSFPPPAAFHKPKNQV